MGAPKKARPEPIASCRTTFGSASVAISRNRLAASACRLTASRAAFKAICAFLSSPPSSMLTWSRIITRSQPLSAITRSISWASVRSAWALGAWGISDDTLPHSMRHSPSMARRKISSGAVLESTKFTQTTRAPRTCSSAASSGAKTSHQSVEAGARADSPVLLSSARAASICCGVTTGGRCCARRRLWPVQASQAPTTTNPPAAAFNAAPRKPVHLRLVAGAGSCSAGQLGWPQAARKGVADAQLGQVGVELITVGQGTLLGLAVMAGWSCHAIRSSNCVFLSPCLRVEEAWPPKTPSDSQDLSGTQYKCQFLCLFIAHSKTLDLSLVSFARFVMSAPPIRLVRLAPDPLGSFIPSGSAPKDPHTCRGTP